MRASPPRKPCVRHPSVAPDSAALPSGAIDALYGLEPVFEPGGAGSACISCDGTAFELIQCPFCGERFETLVDLTAGSADYVEDCQVCCQPIELSLEVDEAGAVTSLGARRGN